MTEVDDLNALFYRRNRDLPLPTVLAAFASTHQKVQAAVGRLSDEDLAKPGQAADPELTRRIDKVRWNTYEHYLEHRDWLGISRVGPGDSGRSDAQFSGQIGIRWLAQRRAVREDECRNGAPSLVDCLDQLGGARDLVGIDPAKGNIVSVEESLRSVAIAAPGGAVHDEKIG